MQSLIRKSLPKSSPVTELARLEQQAWEAELAARKAARPLPTKPTWA